MTPRFVGLALYAEGRTDHAFLRPLIRRLVVAELGEIGAEVDVSVLESTALASSFHRDGLRQVSRHERISTWAADVQGGFHLLFVHGDADGDPERARRERTQPGIDAALSLLGGPSRVGVSVVPVRETEAWVLADPEAVAGVMRMPALHRQSLEWLGECVPEARADPKADLERLVTELRPRRASRRRVTASELLEQLGETVSLTALSTLPSFRRLRDDVQAAIPGIGIWS